MIIAHLPAGYLLGRASSAQRGVLGVVLLASILPDFDMLWFHLVDGGSVHHHRYWPHIPAFWAGAAVVILPLIAVLKRHWLLAASLGFCAILLHLLLDTLVGDVMWLWPIRDDFFSLATVPATHAHWMLSFMLHWSFGVELLICAIATFVYLRKTPR